MSLRNLAGKFPIGTAVHSKTIIENPLHRQTLAREFNLIVPEVAMKCHVVCASPHSYDYSSADTIVEFATEHQQQIRGHVLCWHQSYAPWMEKLTSLELENVLRNYIYNSVERYQGKCYAWDVVNEAINDRGRPRPSIWRNIEYHIQKSFQWAHQADPQAQLIYVDYRLQSKERWNAVAKMVAELKEAGIPIHAVGFQFYHDLFRALQISSFGLPNLVKQFQNLGVKVHLSEVALPIYPPTQHLPETAKQELQAIAYSGLLRNALTSGCESFCVWGFSDRRSLHQRDKKATPYLFDQNYQPKPAYFALAKELEQQAAMNWQSALIN